MAVSLYVTKSCEQLPENVFRQHLFFSTRNVYVYFYKSAAFAVVR